MKTAILWFKNDLRLHDNETLVRVLEQNERIIPVYCFDEAHFQNTTYGFQKTGAFRAQFLLESLADLDKNLRKRGSGLLVLRGKPTVKIREVAETWGAAHVYTAREDAFEEQLTIANLQRELQKINCGLLTFQSSTLYREQELPFPVSGIPDVFTDFRKQVERMSSIGVPFNIPASINSPEIGPAILPTIHELGLLPLLADPRSAILFQGGETAGLQRLDDYLFQTDAVAEYKQTRNGMIGERYSSKFSAWLSMGCLSPREILFRLKKYEAERVANESTYWLFFELLWREYFRWIMRKYQQRFFSFNGIKRNKPYQFVQNNAKLTSWVNGETGNDFVDACMVELKLSGFMSNRGRQNAASYLCNELQLDWRYGAAYFEQQLIDYDVCSNWGNWAYVAGAGNDPRGKRFFNTQKQAADYDKDHAFRFLWLNKR